MYVSTITTISIVTKNTTLTPSLSILLLIIITETFQIHCYTHLKLGTLHVNCHEMISDNDNK